MLPLERPTTEEVRIRFKGHIQQHTSCSLQLYNQICVSKGVSSKNQETKEIS